MPLPHNSKNIVQGNIVAGGSVIIGDTTYINNYFAGKEVKIPHRLTNYIPNNAEYILGRDTELEAITKCLEAKKPTVLVNGIGGIGKTSVAIKYMAIHGEQYKHLAWLTVQSSILEAFISNSALLESLQITEKVQNLINVKQFDNAFELVFHQFNILEKTLVVLDNANDLEDLEKYEHLFDTASCHFLITSRTYPKEWTTITIDCLPQEEALLLFKKLHPLVQASDDAIKSLLSKLYYHTLLIELVAKSIESSAYLFEELQEIIDKQFIHSEALNEDVVSTGKHGSVVKDNLKRSKIEDYIWLIFSRVKGLDKKSRNILLSIALLPLAFMIERNDLKEHFSIFDLKKPMPDLVVLVERGWVDRIKTLERKTCFKMHPLVADVVVKQLGVTVNFANAYIKNITEKIHYDTTNVEHSLLDKNKNKIFAERLSNLFFQESTESIAELLDKIGYLYENFGYYKECLKSKERVLEIAEQIFDSNHVKIAIYKNNLGRTYQILGEYEKAVQMIESAIVIDIINLGKEHPTTSIHKSNLATVFFDLEKFIEASVILEEVLLNELKHLDENHPSIAVTQLNLAIAYKCLGKYTEAVELLESAIAIDLKNFNDNHPEISIKKSNLANIYKDLGEFDRAIELLNDSLKSDLSNFGENHPRIGIRKNNLAIIYRKKGEYVKAKILWKEAYQNFLANFGESHPYTNQVKRNLEN